MSTYTIDRSPGIVAGRGALGHLTKHVQRLGAHRVFLVSDQGMTAAGWVGRLQARLAASFEVLCFIAPPGEPKVATVDEGATIARQLGERGVIVGLGGGTALDIAKLIAAVAAAERPTSDYILCLHPYAGKLPSIMIPSTSGTGAEVTRTCVLSDAEGRKSWAWGNELCPDLAVLDPEVTVTLPPALTAATGLDAFVHAVEAATGQRTNAFAQSYALHTIRLVVAALPVAVATPDNLEARQSMQEAACLAGMAINLCGTGIAHNIGHALGTVARLPHGVAVTIAMQGTLRWNVERDPARYAGVAAAMQPGSAGADVPQRFDELLEASQFAGAVAPFRQVTVDPGALLESMLSTENLPMMSNNARVPGPAQMEELAARTVAIWQRYQAEGTS